MRMLLLRCWCGGCGAVCGRGGVRVRILHSVVVADLRGSIHRETFHVPELGFPILINFSHRHSINILTQALFKQRLFLLLRRIQQQQRSTPTTSSRRSSVLLFRRLLLLLLLLYWRCHGPIPGPLILVCTLTTVLVLSIIFGRLLLLLLLLL